MKNLKYLPLVLALVACATANVKHIPAKTNFFGIDFTKYSKIGFLITPEKYIGDYESVGIVTVVIYPSANYLPKRELYSNGSYYNVNEWIIDDITVSQGLDSLYTFANSMGADAIMNFEIKDIERKYNLTPNPVTIGGLELNGFAIKRKK